MAVLAPVPSTPVQLITIVLYGSYLSCQHQDLPWWDTPGHSQSHCLTLPQFNPFPRSGRQSSQAPDPVQSRENWRRSVSSCRCRGASADEEDLIAPFSHAIYLFRPDPQRSICIGKRNSERFCRERLFSNWRHCPVSSRQHQPVDEKWYLSQPTEASQVLPGVQGPGLLGPQRQ